MRNTLFITLLSCCSWLSLGAQQLILTGIIDGDQPGGLPKAVELYAQGTVDLSDYELQRSSNGGEFQTQSDLLTGVYADEFIYLIGDQSEPEFNAAFGTAGDFANRIVSGSISHNGNDAYRLLLRGNVYDQLLNGSSADQHKDGHLYRVSGTGPDCGYVAANFTGGNGTLDGQFTSQYLDITKFGSFVPGTGVADCDDGGTGGGGGGSKEITLISTVQGSGPASPLDDLKVTISGIVVGVFPGLNGYFVQEEDEDRDQNPATSEGIFVFDQGGLANVAVGDKVTLTGEVTEFFDLTEITLSTPGAMVVVESSGNPLPTAAVIDFPVSDVSALEAYEGMRVTFSDTLTITGLERRSNELERFGEISVSAGERLVQYTECNMPDVAGYTAFLEEQARRTLIIDDGRSGSNLRPILLPDGTELSTENPIRAGNRIVGLTGVIYYSFNDYKLEPTQPATLLGTNLRPAARPEVNGNLTVASANVLNYFNGNGMGTFGGNSRGAETPMEFAIQQAKIANALCELGADVVGLVEIENDGYDELSSLNSLVTAIETRCGLDYDYVVAPDPGNDAIAVGLIYRPDVVEQFGQPANLNTQPFTGRGSSRPPLAQTFRVVDENNPDFGRLITVAVNHFKSKGGGCDDDAGDGAGNCNGRRVAAATDLVNWLAQDPTEISTPNVLIVGDLNAYRMEDPIELLRNAGYINTVVEASEAGSFPCGGSPSYVFGARWGSLDYILASDAMAGAVTGAADWPVNAPEPEIFAYDQETGDSVYTDTSFYRYSDHDPVLVGLDFGGTPAEPAAVIASFSGSINDIDQAELVWMTSSERGVAQYRLQKRTADTGEFFTFAQIEAKGDSDTEQTYTFTDSDLLTQDTEYRLQIVSDDGFATVTDAILLEIGTSVGVVVRGDRLLLSELPAGASYRLFAPDGRLLRSASRLSGTVGIDVSDLPAAVYVVVVELATGKRLSRKVFVGR